MVVVSLKVSVMICDRCESIVLGVLLALVLFCGGRNKGQDKLLLESE